MSKKPVIVLVNRRALIARIDRALIKRGHELRIARRGGMNNFLVIDTHGGVPHAEKPRPRPRLSGHPAA
jgi:hypothetical protein